MSNPLKCIECGRFIAYAEGAGKSYPFLDIDGGGYDWRCSPCAERYDAWVAKTFPQSGDACGLSEPQS